MSGDRKRLLPKCLGRVVAGIVVFVIGISWGIADETEGLTGQSVGKVLEELLKGADVGNELAEGVAHDLSDYLETGNHRPLRKYFRSSNPHVATLALTTVLVDEQPGVRREIYRSLKQIREADLCSFGLSFIQGLLV